MIIPLKYKICNLEVTIMIIFTAIIIIIIIMKILFTFKPGSATDNLKEDKYFEMCKTNSNSHGINII